MEKARHISLTLLEIKNSCLYKNKISCTHLLVAKTNDKGKFTCCLATINVQLFIKIRHGNLQLKKLNKYVVENIKDSSGFVRVKKKLNREEKAIIAGRKFTFLLHL